MIHFLIAFAIWLHGLFWGAGLASLVTPSRWRRFWPVWMPLCGWTLQSSCVWLCAHAGIGGTDTYAWWTELVPLALILLGIHRQGARPWSRPLARLGALWALGALILALLCLPYSLALRGLGALSLGSCDAADYAAGARTFQDFSLQERTGFLGQTEVVRVMSVDNVPDFWLRLNHFTPSALMAHHGSILACRPHQVAGLFTLSLLAGSLPLVFWMSRALFRFGSGASLGIAALFGITPITWYAVAHIAPAQMLATQGIAALSMAGILAWRRGAFGWRSLSAWFPLLAIACGLLFGSYNFILLVAFAPCVAWVLLSQLTRFDALRLATWGLLLLGALLTSGLLFWGRLTGLIERFLLFRQYDFGWRIPLLGPDGWLGLVSNTRLHPLPALLSVPLAGLIVVLCACCLVQEEKRRSFRLKLGIALFVPAMLGYSFLHLRGWLLGTNASYDAYKILSVFYPGILCTLAMPLLLLRAPKPFPALAWTVAGLTFGLNAWGTGRFIEEMAHPPLRVTQALVDLRHVDKRQDVGSLNMMIPDFWDRLWANAFLMRHEQHFQTHTYEGRLPGPLKGEWDLSSDLVRVTLPSPTDSFRVGEYFSLNRVAAPGFLRVALGPGWHRPEGVGKHRWVWSGGEGHILIENPSSKPLQVEGTLRVRACGEKVLCLEQDLDFLEVLKIGREPTNIRLTPFTIPPGQSSLTLRTPDKHQENPPGESRRLGVCLFDLELRPRADRQTDKALASP